MTANHISENAPAKVTKTKSLLRSKCFADDHAELCGIVRALFQRANRDSLTFSAGVWLAWFERRRMDLERRFPNLTKKPGGKMGRPRSYKTNAARQRAYRYRLAEVLAGDDECVTKVVPNAKSTSRVKTQKRRENKGSPCALRNSLVSISNSSLLCTETESAPLRCAPFFHRRSEERHHSTSSADDTIIQHRLSEPPRGIDTPHIILRAHELKVDDSQRRAPDECFS